ncbi:ATP-binding protein [Micropruina glycogenica]|uniref:Signal transduction histidine kinase n=1 Tax=Micropruina glycogenica TaxID=75385 RepID=A0A2N9JIF1_9ACTN|nr:ATP-binding protein [Micropruina glycogenica]SPD87308.1 Signal transduction histidine kinase [Micropruina glycogenica]
MSSPSTLVQPVPRRADRRLDTAWLGGVCSGLAAHLNWPVLVLRLGFVLLSASMGIGVLVYLVLWLAMPLASEAPQAPGIEAASRSGMRTVQAGYRVPADLGLISAVALLGAGLLWFVQAAGWGAPAAALWPALAGTFGLMLIWWQADHIPNRSMKGLTGWRRWFAPLLAHWSRIVRILLGLLGLVTAVVLIVVALPPLPEGSRTLIVLGLVVVALLLAAAPWIIRVRRSLATIREDKMLADARADMAAHLHDSVLQTLALIQRQAQNPKAVAALARRQERELRSWLYGETAVDAPTVKAALVASAAEVEDAHGVDIDIVVVGDRDLDGDARPLVQAAREAMVNAAKHAGVAKVDVYAEVDDDAIEVFVRDRGGGFVLDDIPADRMGVRGSIIERLRRAGGNATIRSAPETGTEVRLEMKR